MHFYHSNYCSFSACDLNSDMLLTDFGVRIEYKGHVLDQKKREIHLSRSRICTVPRTAPPMDSLRLCVEMCCPLYTERRLMLIPTHVFMRILLHSIDQHNDSVTGGLYGLVDSENTYITMFRCLPSKYSLCIMCNCGSICEFRQYL